MENSDRPACFGQFSPLHASLRCCNRCKHSSACMFKSHEYERNDGGETGAPVEFPAHERRAEEREFMPLQPPPKRETTAADVLAEMAKTYRDRNAVYGDNFKMVARMVGVLFPDGVPPELVVTDQWHLFELKLVKLSRFAISGLTHVDSVHDDAVYGAMIEAILRNKGEDSE